MNPGAAPHGVYPAAGDDAWIAIAVESDEAWTALLAVAEGAPRLRDERFASGEDRLRRQDELDEIVADWTRPLDAFETA